MFLVVVLFIFIGLWVYPVTLMAKAADGELHLYWLPRLFAAYAQPVEISLKQGRRSKKNSQRGRKKLKKKSKKKKLHLLLDLLGIARLEKLWFNFLLLFPGTSQFNGECIISVTVCDIIGRAFRRMWRRIWRR